MWKNNASYFVLVNVHFLNNQILYNDHRRQKNVACFYEQHFWISIQLFVCEIIQKYTY